MDSKSPFPSNIEDDTAPPSYNDTISSQPSTSTSTFTSNYYSSQILAQLATLTTQISSLQTQNVLLSHAQDEKILSLLTTHIQLYLVDFARTGLQKGTLILVPAAGLTDEKALPCDYDFADPLEYDRVVRVRDKTDGEGNEEKWYWRDEEMAIRLAGYLRPPPEPKKATLPERPDAGNWKSNVALQQAETGSSSKGGFWRKRSSVSTKTPVVEEKRVEKSEKAPPTADTSGTESGDKIVVNVKAEEVVFRTENDFGLFETEKGYAVVLKLRVQLGNQGRR